MRSMSGSERQVQSKANLPFVARAGCASGAVTTRKFPPEAFAAGALKCGVLVRLNASARNSRLNRSPNLKPRYRLRSVLTAPGARRMFRPVLPKRAVVTGANEEGRSMEHPGPPRRA